jgi:TonB family protein
MRWGWIFCITLSATLGQPRAVIADEVNEDPLPKSQVLTCGALCVDFTPAKPLKHQILEFPRGETFDFDNTTSEGFVWLRYTIGVDGNTHDISQIYGLGNPEFSRRAIATVKNWTFEPAQVDGKPVPQSKNFAENFSFAIPQPMRQPIIDAYKNATTLFENGKTDEAAQTLEWELAKPRISLIERSILALPRARIALLRKDYFEARRWALMGTVPGTSRLPTASQIGLWEALITADLALGEISEALASFNSLQRIYGFDPGSAYVSQVNRARVQADSAPQLVTQSRVPPEGTEGVVYVHPLYRRTFSFAAITGSLDRYVLACDQSTTESKIAPTAQWHVPPYWSNCFLFVYGAPGTTFRIAETNDDKAEQDQIMAHYDDAIRDDPKNPVRWLARARVFSQANRWADAEADYSKTIELDSRLGVAYRERGWINLTLGKVAVAMEDAEAALRLDPKNKDVLYLHAFALRADGKYREALADLDTLMPVKDQNVYINHAITQFDLGNYAEAEEDFFKSVFPFNNDLSVYNWIHILRTKRGMDDDPLYAVMYLPNGSWVLDIANLYRGRQSLEQAEANMKADRAHPVLQKNWPCSAEFYLGEYKLAHGDVAGAKSDFNAVTPTNCSYAEATAAVAELKRLSAN